MNDISVIIRGIYTTALVKLLLDHGFKIAKPSATIAERFKLKDVSNEWDARIRDYRPLKGSIVIDGPKAHEVVVVLMGKLPDAILNYRKVGYEIYKGIVEKVDERGSYVNYGNGVGLLPEKLSEGQEVIVSPIKDEPRRDNHVSLTRRVRIVGYYADLVKDGWISTPKDVPTSMASRLMNLGHLMKPPGWGVQWKREASEASTSDLLEELQRLREKAIEVVQQSLEVKAPALIYEPSTSYIVILPYDSKKYLDGMRGLVVPTMPKHHLIKSWGRRYAYAVDVIEKLMAVLSEDIGHIASNIIVKGAVKRGAKIAIEHVKPDGKIYKLSPGIVEDFDEDTMTITLKRRFKGGGVYNGLGVPKEQGDYGLSTYRIGVPLSKTAYYSEKGALKGIYVNISTPVEIAPRKVRYVDLEVDVIAKPNGEVRVLDVDKARELMHKGIITSRLYHAIMEIADKVKKTLSERGDVDLDLKLF
ncbi:MAG: DUF402 domain-containing protein [Candidatus Nezhaarchaeales archaeon]|nr:MAG: hypothetical protein DSO06_03365 [Candidatus Nezhaarchaeota archaeon WYZ-LMO8]TDA37245.1 MAG: hypothetical protein DSO05_00625 [Candidatus Nezhaarchaeota archaeon WYZ-LMO7]